MSTPTFMELMRHGETGGGSRLRGSSDDPLTATGWRQMCAAAGDDDRWQAVVTSPLVRCAEFAAALARRWNLPLETDARLREIHFGEWEGRSVRELWAEDPDALTRFWNDPVAHPPPGAEPVPEFRWRVLAAWREHLRRHAGRRVLVVSHGGPIRVILGEVRGLPLGELLKLEVVHAGVTRIRIERSARGAPRATVEAPC